MAEKQTKFIFVTGGVVSGLGKGITAASLGRLLKCRGLKVASQKLDPYVNVDPGTMSPLQHGEVFVTDDLGNDHVSLGGRGQIVDVALDLVGDVGNDLHGLAQICTLTFLVQYVPVHLAGGQVGVFVQILVDKALVVAQIQISLSAIVGHEHLTVLQRAHGYPS